MGLTHENGRKKSSTAAPDAPEQHPWQPAGRQQVPDQVSLSTWQLQISWALQSFVRDLSSKKSHPPAYLSTLHFNLLRIRRRTPASLKSLFPFFFFSPFFLLVHRQCRPFPEPRARRPFARLLPAHTARPRVPTARRFKTCASTTTPRSSSRASPASRERTCCVQLACSPFSPSRDADTFFPLSFSFHATQAIEYGTDQRQSTFPCESAQPRTGRRLTAISQAPRLSAVRTPRRPALLTWTAQSSRTSLMP